MRQECVGIIRSLITGEYIKQLYILGVKIRSLRDVIETSRKGENIVTQFVTSMKSNRSDQLGFAILLRKADRSTREWILQRSGQRTFKSFETIRNSLL